VQPAVVHGDPRMPGQAVPTPQPQSDETGRTAFFQRRNPKAEASQPAARPPGRAPLFLSLPRGAQPPRVRPIHHRPGAVAAIEALRFVGFGFVSFR